MTAHTTCFRVQFTVNSQGSGEELTFDIHNLSTIRYQVTINFYFHDTDSLDLCYGIFR